MKPTALGRAAGPKRKGERLVGRQARHTGKGAAVRFLRPRLGEEGRGPTNIESRHEKIAGAQAARELNAPTSRAPPIERDIADQIEVAMDHGKRGIGDQAQTCIVDAQGYRPWTRWLAGTKRRAAQHNDLAGSQGR